MQPELVASGTLFARIFHASPVAMAIYARNDGRCVAANDAFARLFGYDAGALVGQRVEDLGLLDDEARRQLGTTVLSAGRLADRPLRVRARDGSFHDVLASIQLASWGDETFLIALLQDLTDYHRARRALSEAEARFRLFFEAIPVPVVVYDGDTLAILDVNATTTAQYGYSREELLTMSALALWPAEEHATCAACLRSGDVVPLAQAYHYRRDGGRIAIEMTSQSVTLDGRRAYLATFADVSEQQANAAARRHSEEQLHILADVTTDVIWSYDPLRQTITYSSGMSTLFGHAAGEWPSPKGWLDKVHPDDRDRVMRELAEALPSKEGRWTSQYRFRRADDTYAHVLDRGFVLRDTGEGVHFIGAMVDITRQIELQEATARATAEERRRLARDLHDAVTQSVYSLTLLSAAARRRVSQGETGASFDYVERLGQLARQALKEMRLLVYELRPATLETEPLVTALQTRLEAVEQRAGVATRLRVEAEPHLPPHVQAQLFRVAEEALNNTLKHASATAVDVLIGGDARHLRLEIRDDGIGFLPDPATTPAGLGLVSMRERVSELGGTFAVDSIPGRGTTVRVVLELGNGDNGQSDPHSDL
ncbi:MAG TPA: PAS domain S-box protein [Promineifilum sp.]|nr:PAS domain S-box protein [Promineifilum sp.]